MTAKARAVEYDAAGTRVRVDDDWNGSPAIVIGEYAHVITTLNEAQALIDAIWKAGVAADWTLYHPEPPQGDE